MTTTATIITTAAPSFQLKSAPPSSHAPTGHVALEPWPAHSPGGRPGEVRDGGRERRFAQSEKNSCWSISPPTVQTNVSNRNREEMCREFSEGPQP